jgi:hypothetical protein
MGGCGSGVCRDADGVFDGDVGTGGRGAVPADDG